MATIQEMEAALKARLESAIPGVPVKSYPDTPRGYKMSDPKAELAVVYRGGEFQSPARTDLVIQEREVVFEISVFVRSLKDHLGAYALLEQVRLATQGHKLLPDTRPMWIRRETFIDVEAGQWTWAVFVSTKTNAIPQRDLPHFLKQITVQTPDGELKVP